MLSGRYSNRRHLTADPSVAKDVIGIGGLLHPPRINLCERICSLDSFDHAPLLVGIHHQLVRRPNLLPHQTGTPEVVAGASTYFQLRAGPSLLWAFAPQI